MPRFAPAPETVAKRLKPLVSDASSIDHAPGPFKGTRATTHDMKSENGLSLKLDEVYQAVDISDVLIIALPHLTGRLLFDIRTRPGENPIIRSVPPVRGPDERFAYLRIFRHGTADP